MAYKKYAYYNHGNRVAIVEKESGSSGGKLAVAHCTIGGYSTKDTCEAAGGQWIPGSSGISGSSDEKYISPKDSVTSGIEIEYTYSPIYNRYRAVNDIHNTWHVQGWTIIDGYVTFVRAIDTGTANWAVNTSVSGNDGDTGGQTLDYILVEGSSRWNGIHRIQTAGGAHGTLLGGMLKTYTKAPNYFRYVTGADVDLGDDETIFDGGDGNYLADMGFEVGDYIWMSGNTGAGTHNGVFTISAITTSTGATSSTLTVDKRYSLPSGNTTTPSTESSATASFADDTDGGSDLVTIAQIEHEVFPIYTNIDVLNDENDEIELTSYQSKAIVYYLKAKMAEDQNNIEMREYFMRLFKKHIEKERSGRKRGPYIAVGNFNMRAK